MFLANIFVIALAIKIGLSSVREMNNAEVLVGCLPHEYNCHNGPCIPKDWLCDRIFDCPFGDDESESCKKNCKMGGFKCTKRDLCIEKTAVCDGKVDCPDYSDEYACIRTDSRGGFATATYRGESGYLLCSHNWDDSIDACSEIDSVTLWTNYKAAKNESVKFLKLRKYNLKKLSPTRFKQNVPVIRRLKPSSLCETGKFVNIKCYRETDIGVCGTRSNWFVINGAYIINGQRADQGAWPWHVQIIIKGRNVCEGSIISEHWILTAAHCLQGEDMRKIYVKVGTNVVDDPQANKLSISYVVQHPNFADKHEYDMALMKLSTPLTFTSTIRPICLPAKKLSWKKLMSYSHCIVTGFGRTKRDSPVPPKFLQQGRMNIMSSDECKHNMKLLTKDRNSKDYELIINSSHLFCAGSIGNELGTNTCKGDSGSAFACKDGHGVWTQVGIVKGYFKRNDTDICSNSIVTKVSNYLKFIKKVMKKENPWGKNRRNSSPQ